MGTAQDLVNLSLTLCGRLGAGRTPGVSESTVAFGILNAMLDSWSTQRRTVYSVQVISHALTANAESLTIGTGGDWNTARPVMVESAAIIATVEGQTAHFPMKVVGQDEWAKIERYGDKAAIPRVLYNDNAFPLAKLSLYPIPATTTSLELYIWTPFAGFSTLGDTVTLPPGYYRAVAYALAVELAPAFGLQVPAATLAIANTSRTSIEAMNARLLPPDELDASMPPADKAMGK